MPVSDSLLKVLRCPETGQGVRIANEAEKQRFPVNFDEGALISEDGKRLYPIKDGFPVMLRDESVLLCD